MKHMVSPSPADQLISLRTSLEHFEQSPDFGDSESVAAIRLHLEVRIREAEGALRFPPRMKASTLSSYEAEDRESESASESFILDLEPERLNLIPNLATFSPRLESNVELLR